MFNSVTQRISVWRQNPLLRNAGWMLAGQGLSVVMQAGYFVLLVRLLGPEHYGVFVGAFAFVAIAAPYASMGSGTLFMRHVGMDRRNLEVYLGNILLSSVCIGTFFVLALRLLAPLVLNPASASLVLLLGLANCIFAQLVSGVSQVFQAFERLKITALLSLLVNSLRFLAVLAMTYVLHRATAYQWTVASVVISCISALIGLALVFALVGRPRLHFRTFLRRIPEGFGFSLGGSAQSVYNDVDKTLLSHYGLNLANGIYTTAYRVVDIATLPITALDAAALPRYFNESADQQGVIALALRLGKKAAGMGLVVSAALFASANLLPLILGNSFEQSASALRWLSILPALRGWHQLTGSAIAGLGFQRYRTTVQFSVSGLNLVLNLWLIPRFGWIGAAWASIASDGAICVLNGLVIQRIGNHHPSTPAPAVPVPKPSTTIGAEE